MARRARKGSTNAKDYFTDSEPLGPTITPEDFTEVAYRNLFDEQNLLYRKLTVDELDGPIIVVGRRGSGKTAFLKSTHFRHPSSIVIEFVPNETFRYVVNTIEKLSKVGGAYVEDVRDIWNYLFWVAAFYEVYHRFANQIDSRHLDTIGKFLKSVGIESSSHPYGIFQHIISLFERRYNVEGSLEVIKSVLQGQGPGFDDALDATQDFLEEKKMRLFFLLDNLEDFQLDRKEMRRAIAGLTKCVAEFRQARDRHHLRWCVPAELYLEIIELSSNPLKDFSQQLLLHWHAGELLQLGANRYCTYLQLYEPDFHQRKLSKLNLHDRKDVSEFWNIVFPDKVTNTFGKLEEPIAYILRHTQLLPRQFLRYLNAIVSYNSKEYGSKFHINPLSITEKIHDIEGVIVHEICSAFRAQYPGAFKACEAAIGYLPYVFSYGELHKNFNQHGKKSTDFESFDDYRRMLIEIGAIGVVTGETELYYIGMFEYTEPFKLNTSSDDTLCLHPIFYRTFRAKAGPKAKPVYPFGSDPAAPDKRNM